ncbi:MAG: hypothetical protein FJX30_02055 [Alphaproteobacteria bacterium]|nr:hypothetical protein [Alphaproteobacteria bacterium]
MPNQNTPPQNTPPQDPRNAEQVNQESIIRERAFERTRQRGLKFGYCLTSTALFGVSIMSGTIGGMLLKEDNKDTRTHAHSLIGVGCFSLIACGTIFAVLAKSRQSNNSHEGSQTSTTSANGGDLDPIDPPNPGDQSPAPSRTSSGSLIDPNNPGNERISRTSSGSLIGSNNAGNERISRTSSGSGVYSIDIQAPPHIEESHQPPLPSFGLTQSPSSSPSPSRRDSEKNYRPLARPPSPQPETFVA